MTISSALAEARRHLAGHSATPELDAEVLLAHILNGTRSSLIAGSRDPLDPHTLQRFDQLLERRKQGEPVAYLTGEKEFWSLKLKVTPDVLVPRPETELLVEWALELLESSFRPLATHPFAPSSRKAAYRGGERAGATRDRLQPESSASVLDLGTGSGAIALAIVKEYPEAKVVAADTCLTALDIAQQNARRLKLKNVEFIESDWFKTLDTGLRRYDGTKEFNLILSNPPYIAENDPHLADLRFEPRLALTAGADGLSALREITADAGKYLKPGGWILLEHGAQQGSAVRDLLQLAGFQNIATRRDLAGHERATGGQHT